MKLFRNKEIQWMVGMVVLLLIIFSAVAVSIFSNFAAAVNATHIKQNIAAVGSIVKAYPQLETEIAANYIKGFEDNYQYGKSILEKYSYDESLQVSANSLIQQDLRKATADISIAASLFALVLILFLLLRLSRIYQKLRRISENAEAVVEGNYRPIEGENEEGEIGALIHRFNSMTERLSENVQTLNHEKVFLKRLITDISHQLKTPLASLIMFNDIMKNDTSLSEPDRAAFVAESKNQLDRMEWLIKSMLKMAKLEARVVEFEPQEAPLADTVRQSITGVKNIAHEKNVDIIFSGAYTIKVRHDVRWTEEALSNIIKNCIEHSEPNSEIDISLDENKVFAQIVIQDQGPGIPKSELPRIFDRFYKGTGSTNPTNVGIGLYITKTIIEGQGGSIYVSSPEGAGTKFIVRLMKIV